MIQSSTAQVHVLAADNDGAALACYRELCQQFQMHLIEATDAEEALRLASASVHVAIIELNIQTMGGLRLIAELKIRFPRLQVMVVSSSESFNDAVQAIRLRVFDILEKPVLIPRLADTLSRCLAHQRDQTESSPSTDRSGVTSVRRGVGEPAKPRWREELEVIARNDRPVLLTGESGTGRSEVARLIHEQSERHQGPFVSINCWNLQTYFDGSVGRVHDEQRIAANQLWNQQISEAVGGTLFLSAVDALPLQLQTMLLALLPEDRTEHPAVKLSSPSVNSRIIAATTRDLYATCKARLFREDLYYRLEVMRLDVPPLRERRMEIPELIASIAAEICERHQRAMILVDPFCLAHLMEYPWPGNLPELRHVLEQAIRLCKGNVLTRNHLKQKLVETPESAFCFSGQTLADIERYAILQTLFRERGNKSRAAKSLAISTKSIYAKMRKLGITATQNGRSSGERQQRYGGAVTDKTMSPVGG